MRGLASIPLALALLFATPGLAGGEEPSPASDDPNPLAYKGPAVFDPAMLGKQIPVFYGWDMINYRDLPPPTSDCIGDLVTPKCALDTYFSCRIKSMQSHCEDLGHDTSIDDNALSLPGTLNQFRVFYYRIDFTAPLTADLLPDWGRCARLARGRPSSLLCLQYRLRRLSQLQLSGG